MIIDGQNYLGMDLGDVRTIGQFYLRNLFMEHLHCMDAWNCSQLDNEEIERARKQIESDESLKDDFLEEIMQKFYDDEVLDTICEQAICDMDLELDDEEDDEDDEY